MFNGINNDRINGNVNDNTMINSLANLIEKKDYSKSIFLEQFDENGDKKINKREKKNIIENLKLLINADGVVSKLEQNILDSIDDLIIGWNKYKKSNKNEEVIKDDNGNVIGKRIFNESGQEIKKIDVINGQTTISYYEYDTEGNKTSSIEEEIVFDSEGNEKIQNKSETSYYSNGNKSEYIKYDENGEITHSDTFNKQGQITFSYNRRGPHRGKIDETRENYLYYSSGNKKQEYNKQTTYDKSGNILDEFKTTINYNENGNVETLSREASGAELYNFKYTVLYNDDGYINGLTFTDNEKRIKVEYVFSDQTSTSQGYVLKYKYTKFDNDGNQILSESFNAMDKNLDYEDALTIYSMANR